MGTPLHTPPLEPSFYGMKLPRHAPLWFCLGALALAATKAHAQPAAEPSAEPGTAPVSAPPDPPAAPVPDGGSADAAASPPQAAPPAPGVVEGEGEPNEAEDGSAETAEEVTENEPALAPHAAATGPVVPRTSCHGKRIKDILVHGNGRVTAKDVLVTMKLKPGVPCTDDELTRDARALWDLGFFDDVVFEAAISGDEVTLHVAVGEKPAIGKIDFEGQDEVDKEDIDEKVTLSVGQILSEAKVRQQVTKIRDLYAEEGFFLAKITYRLVAMPNNEVAIIYEIDEGPEVSVRRVRFIGNDNVDEADLLKFMRTHPTGLFSFLSSDNTFKRDFFEEDVLRLQAIYFDRGYLNVEVDEPRVELTPDRQQIDITIPLKEGPRFRIGRMRVVELGDDGGTVEPLGGRRKVRSMVEVEPGDWFNRTKVAEGVERITRHYRDGSFAKVQVEPLTEIDPSGKHEVNLTVTVRRGPSVHIQRIQVQGNDKTRDKVIRREILINEGDKYSQTRIDASKDRITALGYFERVDVSEEEGSDPDGFILTFEVAEKSTGTFQVGAGFSSIEQFVLTAQIQQQNLFGHGQSLTLNAQFSGLRVQVDLNFFEPYLFDTLWSGGIDLSRTRSNLSDFTQRATTGGVSIGHPLFHRNLRASLRYAASFVEVEEATGGLFGASDARGRQLQRFLPLEYLQLDGFTSSVRFALTWDSRDNRLFPTKGIYTSLSSEIADPTLGSQRTFIKNEFFGRFYYPIFRSLVLKLNTQLGLVTSRLPEGVPIYERYFLGGIMSIRGYDLLGIGPRAGLNETLNPLYPPPPGGFAFGGNLMARYNLELEFPIVDAVGIKGVLFMDGGNAWNLEDQLCQVPKTPQVDATTDPCSFSQLRYAVGFGFRWFSPLGPLRFEWGIPLDRRSWEQPIRFEFTIGNFF